MRRLLDVLTRILIAFAELTALALCVLEAQTQLRRAREKRLVWGVTPLINNVYWSRAMAEGGWSSRTLMTHVYSIMKREDFDAYLEDYLPSWIPGARLRQRLTPYAGMFHLLKNADLFFTSFRGGPLGLTPFWRLESRLLKRAGIKTVVMPFGSDGYMYSEVEDLTLRHGLLLSYPMWGRMEKGIRERVRHWTAAADVLPTGILTDGVGRWDVLTPSYLHIDTALWKAKEQYSTADGTNGEVVVVHAPNHRGLKGTEFLLRAVDELKAEGLRVKLMLLEGQPNERVREVMKEADILAEHFLFSMYALTGIEGMASGLPVLCNLENEHYTRVFRRYAFLDECPVLSTDVESLRENLRRLVVDPALRERLGRAGRSFAEKYHSYEAARFLFGRIASKLLEGAEVDLMNLFHPLTSEFNRRLPKVDHPLRMSRLPSGGAP